MRELLPIRPVPPVARDMDIMENRLPSTQALAGETIGLRFEDDSTARLTFSASHVRWSFGHSGAQELGAEDRYDAVEIRPGIFFVDFSLADRSMAFSHIIDREHGRALTVWSRIFGRGATEDLQVSLRPATLSERPVLGEPIEETRELIGKRLYCEYSREAALEHIYVNSATIVWQWLLGPPQLAREVGIEAVSMWKIRDRLYLLAARGPEPIQLTLLLDLERMRNVGRIFGRGGLGEVDRRCGAKITFLGDIAYPADRHPG
jgi:MoaF N-terminal domain/MoaF C-terminal domain